MKTGVGFDTEKTQAPSPDHDENFYRGPKAARGAQMETTGCDRVLMSSTEILAKLFAYHPPTAETLPKYGAINQAAKNFAEVILQNCPPSADRSDAIRKIREARMTANASIALDGLSL